MPDFPCQTYKNDPVMVWQFSTKITLANFHTFWGNTSIRSFKFKNNSLFFLQSSPQNLLSHQLVKYSFYFWLLNAPTQFSCSYTVRLLLRTVLLLLHSSPAPPTQFSYSCSFTCSYSRTSSSPNLTA